MKDNFLLKSKNKKNYYKNEIKFEDKFVSKFYFIDSNESGNIMDHNLFEGYYFDELYNEEALFFANIKNISSSQYSNDLKTLILNEKAKNVNHSTQQVNKFKKKLLKDNDQCIRSGCRGLIRVKEN